MVLVTATYPPNTTLDQFRQMEENLLADRFELVFHRQSRPVTGYEMTVASTGLKISSTNGADPASTAAPGPGRGNADRNGFPVPVPGITFSMVFVGDTIRMTFRQATMGLLANRFTALISRRFGGPRSGTGSAIIIDKTGLKDKFDFQLQVPAPGNDLEVGVANISPALEKQLGLHLTATKTTVDLIVIDHAAKVPIPN
jgi:uncharacterized protein (TIGR03435 family)